MDRNLDSERLTVTIPATMLAQIDAQIGGGFVDRDEFIRAATRHYLEYQREINDADDVVIG
jgi:metal-responsive CopG/Arc/MetJ family transcriptional regulator